MNISVRSVSRFVLGGLFGILIPFPFVFITNMVITLGNAFPLYLTGAAVCAMGGYFAGYYFKYKADMAHAIVSFLAIIFLVAIHYMLIIGDERLVSMLLTTGFNSMDILVMAAVVVIGWQGLRISWIIR